jgi:hypothetical protein
MFLTILEADAQLRLFAVAAVCLEAGVDEGLITFVELGRE